MDSVMLLEHCEGYLGSEALQMEREGALNEI